jgi:hypothetical protein
LPREVNVSSTSGGYWWGTCGITPQPEIAGVLQCSSELTGRATARQFSAAFLLPLLLMDEQDKEQAPLLLHYKVWSGRQEALVELHYVLQQ